MRVLGYVVLGLGPFLLAGQLWKHDWLGALLLIGTLVSVVGHFPPKKVPQ